jgi:glycosyltransferase involved in cell wall biosynthesis
MRYAFVTETWPPEVNGVALTVQSMRLGLQALGHEVSLFRPRHAADGGAPGAPGETLLPGLPIPRYPGLRFGLPAARAMVAAWHDEPPGAIYVATEGPLGWSALRAARRLGIPAATGFHTRFDAYMRDYGVPFLGPVALAWMRRFHNRAQATLVPTRELQDRLAGEGFRNVVRLARAVDASRFSPAHRDPVLRAAWGAAATHAPVAIHVGRIAAEKNLDLAVRAFRRLLAAQPLARFVFVGDGPERERLARANPDFVFCGVQRGEALARHFASADLFLFPSLCESFGNGTHEALASGVPAVAFDSGAARAHLRAGVLGAAPAPGDEPAFIEACMRIGTDADARARMAAAAPDAVARLQPRRVTADLDGLLRRLQVEGRHARAAAA